MFPTKIDFSMFQTCHNISEFFRHNFLFKKVNKLFFVFVQKFEKNACYKLGFVSKHKNKNVCLKNIQCHYQKY